MAKYDNRTYKTSSSCGGSNMNSKIITCEDKIYVVSVLQSYVLNKGYTYLLPYFQYRMERQPRGRIYS